MTLSKLADQVQSAVRLGDAIGKTEDEIHADVHAIVGHLPQADLDAIQRIVADDVAHTWR
ncbi:hypothetical protein [Streptomyces sp. NPDC006784]|uniref:hypothetical protein n=1 Tax=Streptomyces sp. NPDC006784 TaxID=3364764 RepID=UPI00368885F8